MCVMLEGAPHLTQQNAHVEWEGMKGSSNNTQFQPPSIPIMSDCSSHSRYNLGLQGSLEFLRFNGQEQRWTGGNIARKIFEQQKQKQKQKRKGYFVSTENEKND